ncbi:MAG: hypothetical protein AB7D02_03400 [Candidatus Paceibacterota bacterium]
MEDFPEICLRSPRELVKWKINNQEILSDNTESSFEHPKDKNYLKKKAWLFAGIFLRERLLRKKRLTKEDAEMLRNILLKKYRVLSKQYIKTVLRNNWYALLAEEENSQHSLYLRSKT